MLRHPRARNINWAVVLIIVGILCRFGLWLRVSQNPPLLIVGDGGGYEQIVRNVIEGNGYSMEVEPPYKVDMLRTPGYPLFILGIYQIVGYRPEIVTLVQNILSLVTLYVAYRLAVHLFGPKEALIATTLMAVDVGTIILMNVMLTETLFMALFVPATYCLLIGLDSPHRWRWMAAAGALFGLATLVRPAAIFLPFLLLPFIWWAIRDLWLKRTIAVVLLLAAYLLFLSPWSYRNWQVFGSPNITLAAQSMTLNIHASYVRAGLNHTTLAEEEPRIPEEIRRELGERTISAAEMEQLIQTKAIAELKQHPGEYVLLYLKSMGLTLLLPNTNFLANILGVLDQPTGLIANMRARSLSENIQALSEFSRHYLAGSPDRTLFLIATVAEILVVLVTLTLATVGIIVGLRNRHRVRVVLLLVIIAYFFVVTGPIGTGRYRLPTMPYLMMLAGYGFVQAQIWRHTRRAQKLPQSIGQSE